MKTHRIDAAAVLAGLVFVVVAVAAGAQTYGNWDIAPAVLWAGLLMAGGVTLIVRSLQPPP